MTQSFRVALTRDFLKPDGTLGFGDIGLSLLDQAGIPWEYLAEKTTELRAEQVRDFDALLLLGPRATAVTFNGAERLALIARFGPAVFVLTATGDQGATPYNEDLASVGMIQRLLCAHMRICEASGDTVAPRRE